MTGDPRDLPPQDAWLRWGRELQAIAQTGLAFGATGYDLERYRRIMAIAAEMVAAWAAGPGDPLAGGGGIVVPAARPDAEILARLLAHLGYATPKIDVRAAIVRDGRILLVQERMDERWAMPGGWADVGEPPSAMVAREVIEESGLVVVPRRLLAVFDANREGRRLELFHAYKMVFLCEEVGGTLQPGDETLAADFFDFDALPPLSTARTNDRYLAEVRAHLADSARPAFFD